MPNLLLQSSNQLLSEDLISQIEYHLSEYKVFTQDNQNTVFDIAILDGNELLSEFRIQHPKVPALILEPSDSNQIIENNLDVFIFKPIVLPDILNQIKSLINVFKNSSDGFLSFGDYELHPVDKEVLNLTTQQVTKLTEREVSIIQYLYKSQNKFVSKQELLENVWEYNSDVSTHTIETHIYRLRKKIESTPQHHPIISAEDGNYKLIF